MLLLFHSRQIIVTSNVQEFYYLVGLIIIIDFYFIIYAKDVC